MTVLFFGIDFGTVASFFLFEDFSFDFIALELENFKNLPVEESPATARFYYEQWQKDYFEDTIQRHGESIQAMGKIYSRIRIKSLQRIVSRESQWDDVKWRAKAVSIAN